MKNDFYSIERNAQIAIALLKAKSIKKVVASPGTTNIAIVGSMMHDNFFEMYSAPDERSAAYIACGLAAESGEPVVLSCTGATASRNYFPGLTEAYYRKLPIIALTSALDLARSGHLQPQFCDRSRQPVDTVKLSVQIPPVDNDAQAWECTIKINNALLETQRHGGGPVHINLTTRTELYDFSVQELPQVRNIIRFSYDDEMPNLPEGRLAIFIGSHRNFTSEETSVIDLFCASNDAVVFCDHTSGYYGKYRVQYALAAAQKVVDENVKIDLLIHIGEVSGDYYTLPKVGLAKQVWRVSPDGEVRDYFKKLTYVFEMEEKAFFSKYSKGNCQYDSYLKSCQTKLREIRGKLRDLPFSNMWAAGKLTSLLPINSIVHFGILNTLRSWNFVELPQGVQSYCNVGGFGIDGILSTVIGASLVHPDKLYFCFVGDLAFFYDLNSLGNRHVGKNLRIMLINNGKGTEFRNHTHPGSRFGEDADLYIAAGGHYGNKSQKIVKHYAEDLGFTYLSAANKEEFLRSCQIFISSTISDCSVIFEIFTTNDDEDAALKNILNIECDKCLGMKNNVKTAVKKVLGDSIVEKRRR